MSHTTNLVRGTALVSVALSVASCMSSYGGANRSSNVREVGSVHVAVLSVAPWSRYVKKLQPDFDLSADEALREVLPDTGVGRTNESSAIGLTGNRTEGDELGPDPSGPTTDPYANEIPPWLDNLEQQPADKPDPFLRYSAAAALFQEVQMLNSAVRDAAIPRGHVGFVVRMQVTLLPRRRHAPYDAYTSLGFFLPGAEQPGDPGSSAGAAPSVPMRGDEDLLAMDGDLRGPRVIPLLVTDSLEATLRERSAAETFALSLTVASFRPELSQLLGLDSIQQASQNFMRGRDLNATMTVGRLSENTLQVRLGAMQEVTADYAMVPRTYNITALVTVPEGRADELELVARTRLVDAETGVQLPGTTDGDFADLMRSVLADYGLKGQMDLGYRLLAQARANDDAGFGRTLADTVGTNAGAWQQRGSLWIDLVGLVAGSQYSSDRIDLPDPGAAGSTSEFFYDQTPLLTDSGADSTIRVTGLTLEQGVTAEALLEIRSEVPVMIPAESVMTENDGAYIELTFPSLQTFGLLDETPHPPMTLHLQWGDQKEEFVVVYRARSMR